MAVGLRVTRGPDWPYGEQDGGRSHVGTVVRVNSDTNVTVCWDMGGLTQCRVGEGGKHDILVLDSIPTGLRHPGTECVRCEDGAIKGALWKCQVCKNASLCTSCYYSDGHLPNHAFSRIDFPGADPVSLGKRSVSQRGRALGIYRGAEVSRGPDWEYGNQDGGPGKRGNVDEALVSGVGAACRISVKVTWANGTKGEYRLGREGKVDLECMEEGPGPDFYIEHLARVDVPGLRSALSKQQAKVTSSSEIFQPGDRVCVAVSTSELKQLNKGRGFTRQLTGEVGVVKKLVSDGDVLVDFKGDTLTITAAALKKLKEYKTGDQVRVVDARDKVHLLQTTRGGWTDSMAQLKEYKTGDQVRVVDARDKVHLLQTTRGGWTNSMAQAIGKTGKVTMVDEDGDVVVNFGGKKHVFHPACLEPSSGVSAGGQPAVPGTSGGATPKRVITKPAVPPKPGSAEGATGGDGPPLPPRTRRTDQSDLELSSDEIKADDFYHKDSVRAGAAGGAKPAPATPAFDGLGMLRALIQGEQTRREDFLKAVIEGKDGTVKQLLALDKSLAQLKYKDIPCMTLAAHMGHHTIISQLADAGADVNVTDENGNAALLIAMSQQKGDAARVLIEKGANVNITGNQKLSPLHLAVHKNMIGHLKLLLKKGANPNMQDEDGDTPLHDAIVTKNDAAAEILIADPRLNVWMTNNKHFTTMGLACLKQHNLSVDKLLDREPNLANGKMADDGYYPLHICAVNNHVPEARLLFNKGRVSVNCKNHKSLTPLHLATLCAHLDMVKLLVEHNADVTIKDSDGDTALHLCVKGRQSANDALMALLGLTNNENVAVKLQMARVLIDKGADVDVPNNDGLTPVTSCTNIRLREAIRELANARSASSRAGQVRPSTANVGTATNVNPTQKCFACNNKVADMCFLPCGHQYACADCVRDYRRCPVCRRDVTQLLNLRTKRVNEEVDCKVQ